jgi:hypothetical protein
MMMMMIMLMNNIKGKLFCKGSEDVTHKHKGSIEDIIYEKIEQIRVEMNRMK